MLGDLSVWAVLVRGLTCGYKFRVVSGNPMGKRLGASQAVEAGCGQLNPQHSGTET